MSGQRTASFDCRPGATVIQLVCLTPAMPVTRVASLWYNRYANLADLLCMCYLLSLQLQLDCCVCMLNLVKHRAGDFQRMSE